MALLNGTVKAIDVVSEETFSIWEFFGTSSSGDSSLTACLVTITDAFGEASHTPLFNEYVMVLSGSVSLVRNGTKGSVTKGEGILLEAGQSVCWVWEQPCQYVTMSLPAVLTSCEPAKEAAAGIFVENTEGDGTALVTPETPQDPAPEHDPECSPLRASKDEAEALAAQLPEKYTIGFEITEAICLLTEDGGSCDPFVLVECCGKTFETATKKKKLYHVPWNEQTVWRDLELTLEAFEYAHIEFSVFARYDCARNYLIGKASMQLSTITARTRHDWASKNFALTKEGARGQNHGMITLKVYCRKESDVDVEQPQEPTCSLASGGA